ncbi:hypothetical protein E3G68_005076 [Mycobacteroides abscessus]|uniref:hypothetical protein n=1 Tax=Mycobacteroides abscessus TaxID=36809 RepID=UPI0018778031|nr:hypothetical protein [Mycobacteroides abscessus]
MWRWVKDRRRTAPEPRYAVVTLRGEASDPELLMGAIPATGGAQLSVSAGVVHSSLDAAFDDIIRNGLPTHATPSNDGTWCAVQDIKTGAILHPSPDR